MDTLEITEEAMKRILTYARSVPDEDVSIDVWIDPENQNENSRPLLCSYRKGTRSHFRDIQGTRISIVPEVYEYLSLRTLDVEVTYDEDGRRLTLLVARARKTE